MKNGRMRRFVEATLKEPRLCEHIFVMYYTEYVVHDNRDLRPTTRVLLVIHASASRTLEIQVRVMVVCLTNECDCFLACVYVFVCNIHKCVCIYIYIYTLMYMYIYIYIYIMKERSVSSRKPGSGNGLLTSL